MKPIVLATLLPATLLLTACSDDDDNGRSNKDTTAPVIENVTP
ncbi:Uncharacterised protein [BD1-7 clade bacterium]|nr:Uncharacterised protein [BD1-7 clade bacterium]